MSKKPRSKKHYRPRAVAVPPYLATLNTYEDGIDHRDEDRVFLLRVANRTVDEAALVIHCRLFQTAWLLAAKMEDAKVLRECMGGGLEAIGAYLAPDREAEFTPQEFERLSEAVETCRSILEMSGHVERAQAMAAVLSDKVSVGIDGKPVTDGEILLNR